MINDCALNQFFYMPNTNADKSVLPSYSSKEKREILESIKEFLKTHPDEALIIGNTQFSCSQTDNPNTPTMFKIIIKLKIGRKTKIDAVENSFNPDILPVFFEDLREKRIGKNTVKSTIEKISRNLENSKTKDTPSIFEKALHCDAIDVTKTARRNHSSKQLNIIYSRPID
ncbi:hypothetical protein A3J90_07815 [candidate division WOR-1 bacterium RIFOXYC2_FULL_37_10]|uniref:Uncharacterized protein n=1 Tax=candidate division WOR-1 bacterium RIFOXYB2_FULL_37_13 TaxID=1802579 RepID=A0A1F4SDZ4_UNCSA|nr:MAG: hypothetical protein A2246_04160 [candidate division WOR-1 bacterium RIFOXYA2_FULL_37_7]OGC18655.1 MAG: hypothetical protein A2310_03425 [candidate division WOR-1 bacterium RIFOXYB2_FULL_37_13]OGC32437.1 MAG: hypothetical protein A3J90_07815 [candidate division WOR-1 bacterium RIFOXYC2_FULL_37_10]